MRIRTSRVELPSRNLFRRTHDNAAILVDALGDHDDVQSVSANFNIPEEAMAELSADS